MIVVDSVRAPYLLQLPRSLGRAHQVVALSRPTHPPTQALDLNTDRGRAGREAYALDDGGGDVFNLAGLLNELAVAREPAAVHKVVASVRVLAWFFFSACSADRMGASAVDTYHSMRAKAYAQASSLAFLTMSASTSRRDVEHSHLVHAAAALLRTFSSAPVRRR